LFEAVPALEPDVENLLLTGADAFTPRGWTYAPATRSTNGRSRLQQRGSHASARVMRASKKYAGIILKESEIRLDPHFFIAPD
jgi:hypothetical protein